MREYYKCEECGTEWVIETICCEPFDMEIEYLVKREKVVECPECGKIYLV